MTLTAKSITILAGCSVRIVSCTLSSSPPSPSGATTSESEEDSDSSESWTDSDDRTIPKPPGEVGRPGRGGYTLNIALDWNPKAFKKLRVLS